jgi:capsular exopolysaccharide synthesis family protein
MSRIFDALQRSERERSGTDTAPLPESTELLRRAEREASSEWKDDRDPQADSSAVTGNGSHSSHGNRTAAIDSPAAAGAATLESLSAEERQRTAGRFQSIQISLSEDSRLVSLTDRESPTAEAIRLLGVRLRDLRRIKPLKKVLITSTIPQEGKSTIAANLACVLSRTTEERTLLIGGDLRRPTLSKIFGIHSSVGINDCIRGEKTVFETVQRLDGAGFWIWSSGGAINNPLEALQSPRLPVIMNQLADYFDWIVIDSPPILPLADTSVWMRQADGILLVTRQGITEKKQLQKGLEALDSAKVLGALVNGAIASEYSGYYYRTGDRS